MGQHSVKPSPQERKFSAGKRRWTAIAAGAAVVAAASTTAYAAIGNADSPERAAAALSPRQAKPLNEAARQAAPQSPSPAPKPPAAARPKTTESPAAADPKTTDSPAAAGAKTTKTPAAADPKTTDSPAAAGAKTTKTPAAAQPNTTKSTVTSRSKPAADTTATPKTTKSPAHKPKTRVLASGTCGASYYAEGQMTASGERFDPSAMTAAHKTLPLGSKVRVTNPDNGESVTVRINDRGPYVSGRCLDLSEAAFAAIGNTGAGVMRVKYEVLSR
ncbi:septal ring lytic transglycosylase RlpA family protein [Nonomuraea sp. NPDC050786]|uniref:septal ring lytic transglycosylase RlpA family protein n=1 Tax=Nonomuraea sp. NPDC050786 TaxID=3154840 RepID=UPI0033F38ACD